MTSPSPALESNPSKEWNEATLALKNILTNFVAINKENKKSSVELIEKLVKKEVMNLLMDENPLFKILFREIGHTGSYYDKVRINNANEFDLNVILDLNVPMPFVKIDSKGVEQGFTMIELTKEPAFIFERTHPIAKNKLEGAFERALLDKDTNSGKYFLHIEKVRNWMRGLLDKVFHRLDLDYLKREYGIDRISKKDSGPALTWKFNDIDVDLVPAFVFKLSQLKEHPRISFETLESLPDAKKEFVVITKKSNRLDKGHRQWRMSFPEQERKLITGEQCIKRIIMLLKAFRDKHKVNLNGIASYYLKTVVMHMIVKDAKDGNRKRWESEKNLAILFIEALEYLAACMTKHKLNHIFDFQNNLFSNLKETNLRENTAWLNKRIAKMRSEANVKNAWLNYFPSKEEIESQSQPPQEGNCPLS